MPTLFPPKSIEAQTAMPNKRNGQKDAASAVSAKPQDKKEGKREPESESQGKKKGAAKKNAK